jgi:uncharacterized protein YndB with AHSA1/START domain
MNNNRESDDSVRIASSVPASVSAVMQALTSPALFPVWWEAGWDGCRLTSVEGTPWPGSAFRIEATEKNGTVACIRGEVVSVTSELVRFTWKTGDIDAPPSLVSVHLAAEGEDRTLVGVHHERVTSEMRAWWRSFWRRVLTVMAHGIPLMTEMQRSPLFTTNVEGLADAQSIATFLGRFVHALTQVVGVQSSPITQMIDLISSPPYTKDRARLKALAADVADQLQKLLTETDMRRLFGSIGLGTSQEVQVRSTESSDTAGRTDSIGLQVEVKPDGTARWKIGRLNIDISLDERGNPVGAGIIGRCHF